MPPESRSAQLERIVAEMKDLAEVGKALDMLSALNGGAMILSVVLLISSLLALLSTLADAGIGILIGLVLLILSFVAFALKLLMKEYGWRLEASFKRRIERLSKEVAEKLVGLRRDRDQARQEPEPG